MTDDEKRGKFLCELRKRKKLTQQELGELVHYTDKNIQNGNVVFHFLTIRMFYKI